MGNILWLICFGAWMGLIVKVLWAVAIGFAAWGVAALLWKLRGLKR